MTSIEKIKDTFTVVQMNLYSRLCYKHGSYETLEEAQEQADRYAKGRTNISFFWRWFVEKEEKDFCRYRPNT